jgi:putative Holliday junction resolvase
MSGRILAVDPGEKRIGMAISDPTATLASPLIVIKHIQLIEDCKKIVQLALDHQVESIVVGQALGSDGEETRQARHAQRLAEQIRGLCSISVTLWDESGSTQQARQARIDSGAKRKDRAGHMDDRAAAVILQNYLDRMKRQEQK